MSEPQVSFSLSLEFHIHELSRCRRFLMLGTIPVPCTTPNIDEATSSFRIVILVPKLGYLLSSTDPYIFTKTFGIRQKLGQPSNAAGTSKTTVQTDTHHFGSTSTAFLHQKSVFVKE
jgi:hypothetical protein